MHPGLLPAMLPPASLAGFPEAESVPVLPARSLLARRLALGWIDVHPGHQPAGIGSPATKLFPLRRVAAYWLAVHEQPPQSGIRRRRTIQPGAVVIGRRGAAAGSVVRRGPARAVVTR